MTTPIVYNDWTWKEDVGTWQQYNDWVKQKSMKEAIMCLQTVERDIGDSTWEWPRFPMCKCKPQGIFGFEGTIIK